jgi:hypothetical protein
MASSAIRIQPHVRSVIDPDGAVLLDLVRGKYYSLNGTGAQIWQKLEAGLGVAEIEAELGSGGAPAEQVRDDVREFIDGLRAKQLVHVAG